jgi:anti-sigma-K factor RskA
LWLVVIIAFCAAVYGLWNQQAWWRNAAIIASIISTVGLIIFWSNPVSSPVVSALVFNLLVLGVLLIAHWPRIEAVGA